MPATKTIEIIARFRDQASQKLRGLANVAKNIRGRFDGLTSSLFGLRAALSTVFAGVSAGLLSRSFLQAATTAEQYRVRLRILMGDTEKANALFKEAANYASGVAFEYEQVMGTVTNLSGIIQGGQEEIIKWTKLTGDVAAAAGLDIQTATSQIIRMYSAGAASADLFRERGTLAMLGFQSGVSYTAEQTRKKMLEMWEDPTSALHGAAKELSSTWTGIMSMLSDAWFQFRVLVMDSGVFNYIKAVANELLKVVNSLRSAGKDLEAARKISDHLISSIKRFILVGAVVADIFTGWRVIVAGVTAAFGGLMVVWGKVFPFVSMGVEIILGWFELLLDVVGKLASHIPIIGDSILKAAEAAEAGIRRLRKSQAGVRDDLEILANWGAEIAKRYSDQAVALGTMPTHLEKAKVLLQQIALQAELFAKGTERAAAGMQKSAGAKVAGPAKLAGAELQRFLADQKVIQAQLEAFYEDGAVALKTYFDERTRLLNEQIDKEVEIAKRQLAVAEKPEQRLALETKIYQLEKKRQVELIKLNQQRKAGVNQINEARLDSIKILDEIKGRVATTGDFGLASQFSSEIGEMEDRQRDEMERLVELHREGAENIKEINEARRQHELEREKLLNDQKYRLQQEYLNRSKQVLGFMEEAFGAIYEATGEKVKEFFYLQKAAAIAQTIISTYQAAQDAYKSVMALGTPNAPIMAKAAAAAAIVAGMGRVAAIAKQDVGGGGYAEGGKTDGKPYSGKVKGSSPHSKADDKTIRVTSDEWVHSGRASRHYGDVAMAAINEMRVPREALMNLVDGGRRNVSRLAAFADGGPVSGISSGRNIVSPASAAGTLNANFPINLMTSEAVMRGIRDDVERLVIRRLGEEMS